MRAKVPIVLITGGLGSGKTTLVRRILNTTDRCVAVLINEFGELAVDSRIVQGRSIQIVELAGGCVCCSLTGEFEAAVEEILKRIQPDFILVEATGVAETDALVLEVEGNLPQVRLDSVICIVDAYLSSKHPRVGYAARAQYEAADVVLLNKIDLITTEELKSVETQVRRINGSAVLFKTVGCDVDMGLFFGVEPTRKPFRISPHGEAGFQAFTYRSPAILDRRRFRRFAVGLPPSVYRAKGFVLFDEGCCLFNYVAGRVDLEAAAGESTELVFIGRDVQEDRDLIVQQLRECEVFYAL